VSIPKNDVLKVSFELKKDIKLEKNQNIISTPISNQQRIEKIKNSKLYFSYFYLEGLGSFYFKENSLD
jgi:hypothetical protein